MSCSAHISHVPTGPRRAPPTRPRLFKPKTDAFDYVKREEMVAMRDGVKLKTFILVPKGATQAPMLLTRTPYNASERVLRFNSPHLAAVVPQMDDTAVAAGYIIVFQDVRGKYGSEGDYVMTRPLKGPLNPTGVDHATDTYDTIDWLVKHVPESNGRVGTSAARTRATPPSCPRCIPTRRSRLRYPSRRWSTAGSGTTGSTTARFARTARSIISTSRRRRAAATRNGGPATATLTMSYLRAGSAGAMAASSGLEQLGFWRALAEHTAYDSFWQDQAVDKLLAKEPLQVPMLIVSGLFDQEDIYGGPALYRALAAKDPKGQMVHLVLGPVEPRQGRREGRGIGEIQFEGDTATWFRRTVMQPFLDYYLKDAPKPDTPRVLVYETGADQWHRYDAWPRACAEGCPEHARNLYLLPGGKLGFRTAGRVRAGPTTSMSLTLQNRFRTGQRPTLPSMRRTRPGMNGWWMTNATPLAGRMFWSMRPNLSKSRCGSPASRSPGCLPPRAEATPIG